MYTLGLHPADWETVHYPKEMPAVGNFTAAAFDPLTWNVNYPNPAFVQMTPLDGYWGAKHVRHSAMNKSAPSSKRDDFRIRRLWTTSPRCSNPDATRLAGPGSVRCSRWKDFESLTIIWRLTIWQCDMAFRPKVATGSAGLCGTMKPKKRKTWLLPKTLCHRTHSSLSPRDRILVAGSLLTMQTRDRSPSTSTMRETTGNSSASREQQPKQYKATRGFLWCARFFEIGCEALL
jgi:hypothetical protein